ncbi:MAG: class I SAM-dependent methyltransferase [Verrucomicrobia bacterium]|nr:class I SAM-dependent methyltransferase [Verrucomicrobiota bacterium]
MGLIEEILVRPKLRQKLWAWWYPFFTRRVRAQGIDFLNYAFEEPAAVRLELTPADEPNRPNIQLYEQVRGDIMLTGRRVLEVSCGHGGGASYFARTYRPTEYVGLDLNPEAIRHCQARHQAEALRFQVGDAQRLPFADGSFDVVLNVEASHCYPDFPGFLDEVARVLKPGGRFGHADLRYRSGVEEWVTALVKHARLRLDEMRLINPEVVRGMELNTPRYEAMVKQALPRFLHGLALDFAGVKGSRLHRDAVSGEMSYRSCKLTRLA